MCAWQAVLMLKPTERRKLITSYGRIEFQGGVAQIIPEELAKWITNHNERLGFGTPIFYVHEIPDEIAYQPPAPNLRHVDLTQYPQTRAGGMTQPSNGSKPKKKKKKKKKRPEPQIQDIPSPLEWLIIQNGLGFLLGRTRI